MTNRTQPMKVLILGMGDLGVRIAQIVVQGGFSSTCMLAGKSDAATQWARLLGISSGREVSAARVDGQDAEGLKALLANFEPELIVQCASLLSPFAMRSVSTGAAQAVLKGGFALQLAAQLPVVRTLMQALHELGMECPVINCSYPDVTHPILAAEGLGFNAHKQRNFWNTILTAYPDEWCPRVQGSEFCSASGRSPIRF